MKGETLKVLLVDDDEDDFVITRDLLSEIPTYQVELDWAYDFGDGLDRISGHKHGMYLVDYRLGARTGLELVTEAIEGGCREPIILLTGQGDREVDLEAMRAGAADYLDKGRLDVDILDRAIRYSMERRRAEAVRDKLINDLQSAAAEIKTLNGMLPICSSCKRIRDDSGYWNQLEKYIKEHSHAELSHSICPTCIRQLYPGRAKALAGADDEPEAETPEDADV